MKKKSRLIQMIIGILIIVLSIILQAVCAGSAINGATICASFFTVCGIILVFFDISDIKKWVEQEFFSFEKDEVDVIPWIDPSEYDGDRKEGIIIQFPGSDEK